MQWEKEEEAEVEGEDEAEAAEEEARREEEEEKEEASAWRHWPGAKRRQEQFAIALKCQDLVEWMKEEELFHSCNRRRR